MTEGAPVEGLSDLPLLASEKPQRKAARDMLNTLLRRVTHGVRITITAEPPDDRAHLYLGLMCLWAGLGTWVADGTHDWWMAIQGVVLAAPLLFGAWQRAHMREKGVTEANIADATAITTGACWGVVFLVVLVIVADATGSREVDEMSHAIGGGLAALLLFSVVGPQRAKVAKALQDARTARPRRKRGLPPKR